MIEAIGYIGSICLALCGIPQLIECYRAGNANGLAEGFLWLWLAGTLLTLGYVFESRSYPLFINYGVNSLVLLTLIRYKYFPRQP